MLLQHRIGAGMLEHAVIPEPHHVDARFAAQIALPEGLPAEGGLLHRSFGNDQGAEGGQRTHRKAAADDPSRERLAEHLAELEHSRTARELENLDGFILLRAGNHGHVLVQFPQGEGHVDVAHIGIERHHDAGVLGMKAAVHLHVVVIAHHGMQPEIHEVEGLLRIGA